MAKTAFNRFLSTIKNYIYPNRIIQKIFPIAVVTLKRKISDFTRSSILKTIRKLHPVVTSRELVRIGGLGDGGYLVPNDLEGIKACFSPGVSTTADFEEHLAEAHQIRSYLADYSVNDAPIHHSLFDFEKKFLSSKNDGMHIRLEVWFNQKESGDSDCDYLLQMDIEGAEYRVLIDTPSYILKKFRIIVIEFHSLEMIFNDQEREFLDAIFDKILENFGVVHIHPNNNSSVYRAGDIEVPGVLEFTFYRRDRIIAKSGELEFPHELDRKNAQKPDIVLPRVWWDPGLTN
jgi:hypothetical protein